MNTDSILRSCLTSKMQVDKLQLIMNLLKTWVNAEGRQISPFWRGLSGRPPCPSLSTPPHRWVPYPLMEGGAALGGFVFKEHAEGLALPATNLGQFVQPLELKIFVGRRPAPLEFRGFCLI